MLPLCTFKKQEKNKRHYTSGMKDQGSNVRGVGTVFDTCSNLGQLSSCSFTNLFGYFPESSIEKFKFVFESNGSFWDQF